MTRPAKPNVAAERRARFATLARQRWGGHSTAERFWSRVSPEPNTGCWIWTGAATPKGYGCLWVDGRMVGAHQFVWERTAGRAQPDSTDICHRCDHPWCVNPDHLFAGTRSDNMHDCARKGRNIAQRRPGYVGGFRAPSGLSADDDARMVAMRSGGMTFECIAAEFNVSARLVARRVRAALAGVNGEAP